jgi:hypothetical protein
VSTEAVPPLAEPSPPRGSRRRRDVQRWPIVVVLAVLLVAAIVAGNGHDREVTAPQRRVSSDAVALPEETARSAAWYCPGPPPSSALADAEERVTVANLHDETVDVGVTVVPPKGTLQHRTETVDARSLHALALDGKTANTSALIVEPFASDVVVDATSTAGSVLASAPCATQPSATWHFAAGTTVRGAEDWIVMFNPFGDDAVVDLSFFTASGFEKPVDWQGFTVPRRSRVAIDVGTEVRREPVVATSIAARTGRIVAQQTIVFAAESGRSGVTRSLGAVRPAQQWVFPSGASVPGATRTIAISNPGDLDGEVDVSIAPADDVVIEPVTVAVPRRGVTTVAIGNCGSRQPPQCVTVPRDVPYSIVVRSTVDVPVVAQDLSTWVQGRFTGATSELGSHDGARRWVFARSRVAGEIGAGIDLLATGNATAKADVTFVVDGKTVTPEKLQGIQLRPGVRVTVPVISQPELKKADAAIIVTSDQPIVAERTLVRPKDLERNLGIPARDAGH